MNSFRTALVFTASIGFSAGCGTSIANNTKKLSTPTAQERALTGTVTDDVTQVIALDTSGKVYNALLSQHAFSLDLSDTDKPVHLFVVQDDGDVLPMMYQPGIDAPFTGLVLDNDQESNLSLLSPSNIDDDAEDDAVVPENNPAEDVDSDNDGASDYDDSDDDNDGIDDDEDSDDDGNGEADDAEDLDSDDDGEADFCDDDDDGDGIDDEEDADHGEDDHDGDGVLDDDDADDDNDGDDDAEDSDDDSEGEGDGDDDDVDDEEGDDGEDEEAEGESA